MTNRCILIRLLVRPIVPAYSSDVRHTAAQRTFSRVCLTLLYTMSSGTLNSNTTCANGGQASV